VNIKFNTPVSRASFVGAMAGVVVFAAGAYDWLDTYPNTFINRTTSIPDYPPPEDRIFRKSVFQIHRSCEWKESPPSGSNPYDPYGPVLLYDEILSLDVPCAERLLDTSSRNRAGILLAFNRRSHQLMLREEMRGTSPSLPSEPKPMAAAALYHRHMATDLLKAGVPELSASKVLDACTKSETKWCVENQRHTYIHLWSLLWSTWPLTIGFVLIVVGLAGSFFLKPLATVWHLTGERLFAWIKHG
jgi:hypothetical protein